MADIPVTNLRTGAAMSDMQRRLRDIIFETDDTIGELIGTAHTLAMFYDDRVGVGMDKVEITSLGYLINHTLRCAEKLKDQISPNGRFPWADESREARHD